MLLLTSITIRGDNNLYYYIAKPTLALVSGPPAVLHFKPHIRFYVNNNNLLPAANPGKKIVSRNQTSATNVSSSRGSPSSTNSLLLPVANAGTNQTVNENSTVTLVGAATDPNPSAKLSLSWRQVAGPFVKLGHNDTANPTFTSPSNLPSDTQLKFLLIAKDDRGAASRPGIVTITVKHANLPPVANAGQDQVVNPGYVVSLDGSKSRDPEGSITSYSWTQTSGPAVRLESADTPTPTFTALTVSADTVLKFSLTVKDDKGAISNNHSIVTVTVKALQKPQATPGNATTSVPSIAIQPGNATTSSTGGAATSGPAATNNSAAVVNSLLDKAYAFKNQRNYLQAISLFHKALAIDPNNENALTGIAWALVEDGNNWQAGHGDNWLETMKYSDKALAIDPNNIHALNLKGSALLYGDLGKYNESIAYFDKALSINPHYAAALYNKGEALSKLGMYNESIAYFDKALAIDPNYKNALNGKAWALIDLGNYTQAIPLFDRALAIDPNDKYAHDGRAQAIAATTSPTTNLPPIATTPSNVTTPSNITANNVGTLNNKGWALFHQRNYVQAIPFFEKALAIDPNNEFALVGKGRALNNQGNYAQAIPLFDKALDIDPNYKYALNGKGFALIHQGNYAQAIPLLDKALAIDPNYQAALNNKGWALSELSSSATNLSHHHIVKIHSRHHQESSTNSGS